MPMRQRQEVLEVLWKVMSAMQTFNVEAGSEIHGYGSSGKGGALRVGLRKSFGLRKKEGVIKEFIAGEDFSIFNDTVLALLEAVPEFAAIRTWMP